MVWARKDLQRRRSELDHHRVTFIELFFDLVFVFAIIQVLHSLLKHLTPLGALEAGLLMSSPLALTAGVSTVLVIVAVSEAWRFRRAGREKISAP